MYVRWISYLRTGTARCQLAHGLASVYSLVRLGTRSIKILRTSPPPPPHVDESLDANCTSTSFITERASDVEYIESYIK